MRALTQDEISIIMERTGLTKPDYQNGGNIDIAHMYDIVLTALNSVGKIQYISEEKADLFKTEVYTGHYVENYHGDNFGDRIGWDNLGVAYYNYLQKYGFLPSIAYPTKGYSTVYLDKYVWSPIDKAVDPFVLEQKTVDTYPPIYEASDMGFLLWLYNEAGRYALYCDDSVCDTFAVTNRNFLNSYLTAEWLNGLELNNNYALQNLEYQGCYISDTSALDYRNKFCSVDDWCVGDIIIQANNVVSEDKGGAFTDAANADGENYHSFMYIGPVKKNSAGHITQIAVVECIGDPTYATLSQDTSGKLIGGTAYSVIDIEKCVNYTVACDENNNPRRKNDGSYIYEGSRFYCFRVRLNQNSSYTSNAGEREESKGKY